MWEIGALGYASVVIVANSRIMSSYRIYTWWGLAVCGLSVLSYFVILLIENYSPFNTNEMLGIFQQQVIHPAFWLHVFFCIACLYFIDYMIGIFWNLVYARLRGKKVDNEECSNMSQPFNYVKWNNESNGIVAEKK